MASSSQAVEIESLRALAGYVGIEFGPGPWTVIDQDMINRFADLTGDANWYHTDSARAARELPGGATIAHGLLTLSLLPGMTQTLIKVRHQVRALNYGLDKVRFPAPVPVQSRLRLRMKVESAQPERAGLMIWRQYTLEIDGNPKPALSALMATLVLEP